MKIILVGCGKVGTALARQRRRIAGVRLRHIAKLRGQLLRRAELRGDLLLGREQAVRLQLAQDRVDRAVCNVDVPGEKIRDLIPVAVALMQQRQHAQVQHALLILRVHVQPPSFIVLAVLRYGQ